MYHTAGSVTESFENSLKKLDCEYIDLYLVHWPQVINVKEGDVTHLSRADTS
jgi:diketogulonate reductase-like aldo/keto reductase